MSFFIWYVGFFLYIHAVDHTRWTLLIIQTWNPKRKKGKKIKYINQERERERKSSCVKLRYFRGQHSRTPKLLVLMKKGPRAMQRSRELSRRQGDREDSKANGVGRCDEFGELEPFGNLCSLPCAGSECRQSVLPALESSGVGTYPHVNEIWLKQVKKGQDPCQCVPCQAELPSKHSKQPTYEVGDSLDTTWVLKWYSFL